MHSWYAIDAGWIHRPNFFALPIESSWIPLGLAAFTLGISSGMLNAVYHMFNDTLTTLDNSTFVLATKGQLRAPKIHYSRHLILPTMAMTTKRVPLAWGLVIVDPVFNINGLGHCFAAGTGTSGVIWAIIIITILILLLRIVSHLMGSSWTPDTECVRSRDIYWLRFR